ncbi:cobaltochelatase CobT-related protein [Microvirga solisilvae]|uniref:cobaltochelatase CobT-related protein n=1 Tax=Microvirga solisilvae TaxID=2919498 RepID=UPI001FB048F6|nr:cobalamin biosynthesis protein CobT [Microvirga solisilvae]
MQADIAALEAGARVKTKIGEGRLKDTVVSLLIDHSGSMRGQKTLLTMEAVSIATELLVNLGVKVEVLGFTTSSWQGGTSRWLWLNRGKPPCPGRLCDLLHIIYREASETFPGSAQNLSAMLLPDLLKENVDGEAIEWAVERLRMRPETRKKLIVLSDGAPVDDSTLHANGDGYLMRHLVQVLAEVKAAGDIAVAGLGICYASEGLYRLSAEITTPGDLRGPLIDLLEKVLVDADSDQPQGVYH